MQDAVRRMEKSQNFNGKIKFNCIDIAVGQRNSFMKTWCTNSFRRKDLKKVLHLILFQGESKQLLSRLAAQRICETKFFM